MKLKLSSLGNIKSSFHAISKGDGLTLKKSANHRLSSINHSIIKLECLFLWLSNSYEFSCYLMCSTLISVMLHFRQNDRQALLTHRLQMYVRAKHK